MAQSSSGLAVNTTLSDTLKKVYITLQGDPGTPRDNVILKHAKVALQSEIVRGLTVPEFVDTVDDFVSSAEDGSKTIVSVAIAVYACRALQSRHSLSLIQLVGKQVFDLEIPQLLRHRSILVRREMVEGLRTMKDVDTKFDYRNILRRLPGTDHRKIKYTFTLQDSNAPEKLPSVIQTHALSVATALRNNIENVTNKLTYASFEYRKETLQLMSKYPEVFGALDSNLLLNIIFPLLHATSERQGEVTEATLHLITTLLGNPPTAFLKKDLPAKVKLVDNIIAMIDFDIDEADAVTKKQKVTGAALDVLCLHSLAKFSVTYIHVLARFLQVEHKATRLAASMCIREICRVNPELSTKILASKLHDESNDENTIINLLQCLETLGPKAFNCVKSVMQFAGTGVDSPKIRLCAMKACVAIQIEEVAYAGVKAPLIIFLRDLLNDKQGQIKALALDVISQSLGPAAIRYDKYFNFALKDSDPTVRRSALKSLARLGNAAKKYAVQVAHALEDEMDDIVFQAKETIVALQPPPASATLFIKRFTHKKYSVRLASLDAFVKIFGHRLKEHATKHTKSIVELWSDTYPEVRRVALQFSYDHLCGEPLHNFNDEMMAAITDSDMLAQTLAVQVLKKSPSLKFAAKYMHKVAELIQDDDPPVRSGIVNALASLYRFAMEHENNLKSSHENGVKRLNGIKNSLKMDQGLFIEKMASKKAQNESWITGRRRFCREEIIILQSKNSRLSDQISEQVKAYKEMVDKIKMHRIERRYASQELERMLAEAAAGIGDLTKEEVVRRTLEAEEAERVTERERGHQMTSCRNKERDLINARKLNESKIEYLRNELESDDRRYRSTVANLQQLEQESCRAYMEQSSMLAEDHYQFDMKLSHEIFDYEKYRRTLVESTKPYRFVMSEWNGLVREHRPVPIRVSALQALKSVHTKWKGTMYKTDIENCLDHGESSQIRSAATDLLLFVTFPDQAFEYSRNVVRDLPKLCSKARGSAMDGMMALGAVATQLGSHFVGAHGQYPEAGTFAIPRKFYSEGAIGIEEKVEQVFKLLDIDGSGTLEKREIANAIKKSADVRSVLKSHPALQRFLVPRRWEKTFLAMDTSMDGEVDLSEFIAFIKRTMAGVDPVVSGKRVELNKKWIRLPTKI